MKKRYISHVMPGFTRKKRPKTADRKKKTGRFSFSLGLQLYKCWSPIITEECIGCTSFRDGWASGGASKKRIKDSHMTNMKLPTSCEWAGPCEMWGDRTRALGGKMHDFWLQTLNFVFKQRQVLLLKMGTLHILTHRKNNSLAQRHSSCHQIGREGTWNLVSNWKKEGNNERLGPQVVK